MGAPQVCVISDGIVTTANAGDSRAAVVRVNDSGHLELYRLSADHNTNNEDEMKALADAKLDVDDQLLGSDPVSPSSGMNETKAA
jgi:serine/threonine protein phosphatase PrpC